jgi:hypothetical protein
MGRGQVVFCLLPEDEDMAIFEKAMRLYLPRNSKEAEASAVELSGVDHGNEWGEQVIEERQIRCVHSSRARARSDDQAMMVVWSASGCRRWALGGRFGARGPPGRSSTGRRARGRGSRGGGFALYPPTPTALSRWWTTM